MNIILTGFMGTGKTTVGRILAERLAMAFVDTDELIVERDGRSISDIFAQEGQRRFRAWEATIAEELAERQGMVIATGGRLMLDPDNAAALGQTGPVFCLTATPEEILTRLATDGNRRPLLAGADPEARVRQLLQQRAPLYGRFRPVNTVGRSPAAVADEIITLIEQGLDEQITVTHPGGQYEVRVGYDLLPTVRELAGLRGPVAVVSDQHVSALYRERLGAVDCWVRIPAGEQHKTLTTLQWIQEQLLAGGLDRQGTVVALGGGVVGDVAGFAAATYMRGVELVQCPTSLLAMVDASVGGKTGVDLPQGKNLVGAFKQPRMVIADVGVLATLPAAEFAAGMAEVVKAGLIGDAALWAELESGRWEGDARTHPELQPLVARAIRVKRDVVEEDPFERGRRAVLNLGHTFAHAIEQLSNYTIRHGEAVAIGLVAAARLSAALGHCLPELVERIEALLTRLDLPSRIPGLEPAALLRAMYSDKKKARDRLRFILLRDIGDVFISSDVPIAAVLAVLSDLQR
jgi:3-dehydroquinate synthase